MQEASYRKWDIGLKIAGTVITALGFTVGIGTIAVQWRALDSQIQREIEARMAGYRFRFWEKQLECYSDLILPVSAIERTSNRLNTPEFQLAFQRLHDCDCGLLKVLGS